MAGSRYKPSGQTFAEKGLGSPPGSKMKRMMSFYLLDTIPQGQGWQTRQLEGAWGLGQLLVDYQRQRGPLD